MGGAGLFHRVERLQREFHFVDQVRRSAISIMANIAERFSYISLWTKGMYRRMNSKLCMKG
ncbi:MAG: four helix bundle protein [Fidelibacterota bacterium]